MVFIADKRALSLHVKSLKNNAFTLEKDDWCYLRTSDLRLQTSDLRPQTSDFRGECRKQRRLRRRRYGTPVPNFLWHVDGWDKFAPFGTFIHEAVDGLSQRILWLAANSTKKKTNRCLPTHFIRKFTSFIDRAGLLYKHNQKNQF